MLSFYFDDDSSQTAVVRGLRRQNFHVVVPDEVGMRGSTDDKHLEFATTANLVLCTANARDYLALHTEWIQHGDHHSCLVIIVQQTWSPGEIIRRLTRLSESRTEHTMVDSVEFLSDWGGREA